MCKLLEGSFFLPKCREIRFSDWLTLENATSSYLALATSPEKRYEEAIPVVPLVLGGVGMSGEGRLVVLLARLGQAPVGEVRPLRQGEQRHHPRRAPELEVEPEPEAAAVLVQRAAADDLQADLVRRVELGGVEREPVPATIKKTYNLPNWLLIFFRDIIPRVPL